MFKQVFRLTFVTFIWKKYKRIIVSTGILFIYLWLIGFIHDEYLAFAALQNDSNVGFSFMLKWLALLTGATTYLIYNFMRSRKDKKVTEKIEDQAQPSDVDDPFASIRLRKKLRSKADMIIDKDSE